MVGEVQVGARGKQTSFVKGLVLSAKTQVDVGAVVADEVEAGIVCEREVVAVAEVGEGEAESDVTAVEEAEAETDVAAVVDQSYQQDNSNVRCVT